jgi:hypothetical protein
MRVPGLLFTAILASVPGFAGQSASAERPASSGTTDQRSGTEATVSLEKIRERLRQPAPEHPLRGLHEQAAQEAVHFRVQVEERRKIEELLSTLDFKAGPTPAAGVYGAEMQRIQHPPSDQPLMQPYAAFSTSELLTIAIENLVGKYLAGRAVEAVTAAERARADAAARQEVADAMAEFCGAQPNRGVGLESCTVAPASR